MLVGRRLAGTPAIASPAIAIEPSVGWSNPASRRRSVVLPQPDGPSSEKNSPVPIVSETSCSAANEPNRRVTRRTSTIGLTALMPPSRPRCRSCARRVGGGARLCRAARASPLGSASPGRGRWGAWPQSATGSRCRAAGWSPGRRGKGENELVERDGETDEEAGDQAGADQRQDHPPEGHQPGLAEIERSVPGAGG